MSSPPDLRSAAAKKMGRLRRIGVIVEADVRAGHVLHMGSFGWSRGLVQKNEAVKRIVLNAYHHCRSFARERKERGRGEI